MSPPYMPYCIPVEIPVYYHPAIWYIGLAWVLLLGLSILLVLLLMRPPK